MYESIDGHVLWILICVDDSGGFLISFGHCLFFRLIAVVGAVVVFGAVVIVVVVVVVLVVVYFIFIGLVLDDVFVLICLSRLEPFIEDWDFDVDVKHNEISIDDDPAFQAPLCKRFRVATGSSPTNLGQLET